MKINGIKMGEFDRKSFYDFEESIYYGNYELGDIYFGLRNNFEGMEKASGLTECATAIESTLNNLKKLYKQVIRTDYGMNKYKSSYDDSVNTIKNLCKLIQDKKTAQIIEKHLKYKELKSKNKLTKMFVVMFGRIIKGSEYKKLKSQIKNYQNTISKNLNIYKVSDKTYASCIDNFFVDCMEQFLRQTQQLIYSIIGAFVEAQLTDNAYNKTINSIDDIFSKNISVSDIVQGPENEHNIWDYPLLVVLEKISEHEERKKLRECFVKASNNKVTIRFFKVDISRVGLNAIKFTPKSPVLIEVDAKNVLTSSGKEPELWVKLIQKAFAVYCNKFKSGSGKITSKDMEHLWNVEGMVMCALTGKTSVEEFSPDSWFCKKDHNKMIQLWDKMYEAVNSGQIASIVFNKDIQEENLKANIPYLVANMEKVPYSSGYKLYITLVNHTLLHANEDYEKIKVVHGHNKQYKFGDAQKVNFMNIYNKLKRISYSKDK